MSRTLPILFNTEMVQAILDGRKKVTRRVIKPKYRGDEGGFRVCTNKTTGARWVEKYDWDERIFDSPRYVNLPYQPGDILYVRERFCRGKIVYGEEPDGRAVPYVSQCDVDDDFIPYEYCLRENIGIEDVIWTPSIHMPKEAARIWLKVTDVRVERLQEIDDDGVLAEGLEIGCYIEDLWNSTLKKSDLGRYGWDANPWVWIIEFERCEKPESKG